ncbi:MAG: hypothetical protein WCX32_03025 [Clostridia bacterium]|jgi:NTP pyrophosphatase (non-canonical NTP hydrolase)|nr:hypothetical protein [Clostridia bacterium]MDD4275918.1 hypothetical protein [Clostridia bacterium]
MTKEERLKIYEEATKKWGVVAQYDQCIEEMAELIVAINKYKRKCVYGEYKNKPEIEENLIEELADVTMCIEQMKHFFGEDKIEASLEVKLAKFKKQIDNFDK